MDQLGIDIKQLVAQLINFVLFFLIFKKFIATPFQNFLNDERRKENERQNILEKLKKDEAGAAEERIRMKEITKKEFEKVLLEAKKEAEKIKNELIIEAKKEAEEIKIRAKKLMEEEKDKLNQAAKDRMVDLSIAIVDKAFKDFLDEETKKKITQHILNNFGKKLVYEN